jgi:membrane-bound serine protease (ClpP class)
MDGIAIPIVLLSAGIVAFFLEAFIPSVGSLTIAGACCVLGAIVTGFMHGEDPTTGFIFLFLAIVLVPATLVTAFTLLPKTSIGRRLMLTTSEKQEGGYVAQNADEAELLGQTGTSISVLRPSGKAKIGDRRYDVMTEGEMIEEDTPIEVRRVEGNRIVVRKVRSTDA